MTNERDRHRTQGYKTRFEPVEPVDPLVNERNLFRRALIHAGLGGRHLDEVEASAWNYLHPPVDKTSKES